MKNNTTIIHVYTDTSLLTVSMGRCKPSPMLEWSKLVSEHLNSNRKKYINTRKMMLFQIIMQVTSGFR